MAEGGAASLRITVAASLRPGEVQEWLLQLAQGATWLTRCGPAGSCRRPIGWLAASGAGQPKRTRCCVMATGWNAAVR